MFEEIITIKSSSVRTGDYLYNKHATKPRLEWVRVNKVDKRCETVYIITSAYEMRLKASDEVVIKRINPG